MNQSYKEFYSYSQYNIDSGKESEIATLNKCSDLLSSVSDVPHGLFNNKHPLHLIPHPQKHNVFVNRISYDIQSDSYYENGSVKKYIEFWHEGVLYYENLTHKTEFSFDRTYSKDVMALFPESSDLPSSVIYKFDYSSCSNLRISTLGLKMDCFNENTDYNWAIYISTNLPTLSSLIFDVRSRKWKKIKETVTNDKDNRYERVDLLENLTRYVKNKKISYIKVEIFRKSYNYDYRSNNVQLFPQILNNTSSKEGNFGLDVIIELAPNSIMGLPNNLSMRSRYSNLIEKGYVKASENNLTSGGLFNDKYNCNVLPSKEKGDTYTHRISYSAVNNVYYENGSSDIYLKRWDRGAFEHENLHYHPELTQSTQIDVNMSRTLSHYKKNLPAYIIWKFDYRFGNFYLTSLKLVIREHITNTAKIQWCVQVLPTRKKPNPEFKKIILPDGKINRMYNFKCYTLDLTEIVKDEYGFILKAYMDGVTDGKAQIFRQDYCEYLNDEDVCIDVKVELRPNMMNITRSIDAMSESSFLNDKKTSDFTIKLENNCKDNAEKIFYVHKKVLSAKSEYFRGLFNSQMSDSRNKCLNLEDISYFILEKLLVFIYTGKLENINRVESWICLLYAADKYFLPELTQICELSIRPLVKFDNVEMIESDADKSNSSQLLKFCEKFEVSEVENNEKDEGDIEIIEIPKSKNKISSVINKIKSMFKKLCTKKTAL